MSKESIKSIIVPAPFVVDTKQDKNIIYPIYMLKCGDMEIGYMTLNLLAERRKQPKYTFMWTVTVQPDQQRFHHDTIEDGMQYAIDVFRQFVSRISDSYFKAGINI